MPAQLAIALEEPSTLDGPRPPASRLCVACHQRPARFQYRGVVKADRSHTLCFRCYRSVIDSIRNVEPVGRVDWIRAAGGRGAARPTAGPPVECDKYAQIARRRRRALIAARHAVESSL